MQIATFKDMYVAELQELASMEDQLADALLTMSEMASHPALKRALIGHRENTLAQRQQLIAILQKHGADPKAHTDQAMQALMAALGEIRMLLEGAINALPAPFREVFMLRQVEGLSTEETAHALSIEPETVKTRLHRARTRLQLALQDQLAPTLKDTFPFEGERCQRLTRTVLHRLGLSSEL